MITATAPLSNAFPWEGVLICVVVLTFFAVGTGFTEGFSARRIAALAAAGAVLGVCLPIVITGPESGWSYQAVSETDQQTALTDAVEAKYSIDVLALRGRNGNYTFRAVPNGSTIGIDCTLSVTTPEGRTNIAAGVTCPANLPLRSAS